MFEQTLTTRIHRIEAREAFIASISVFFHAAGIALLLASSWLTLSPVPLPKLHPELIQPVIFPRAGAPAPKLGGGVTAPAVKPAASVTSPQSQETQALQQPAALTASDPAPSTEPVQPAEAALAPAGPGVPDGDPDGSPTGKRGGLCVGDDCDPEGPIGEGPGVKGGPAADTAEIYNPWTNQLTGPALIQSSRALPVYPEIARHAGIAGQVILQAVIDAQGSVGSIVVLRETPARVGFGDAAVRAVSQWRYHPGLLAGKPVAVQMTITVEFTLSA